MFLVEIITFMIVWPIVWWLGGRLSREGLAPPRPPPNVVDLEVWRRRKEREAHVDTLRRKPRG